MTELTKKTTGFLAEFRQFIARGNVLDMAVGVIIGGAFGKISTSLVNDILMPLLSLLTGRSAAITGYCRAEGGQLYLADTAAELAETADCLSYTLSDGTMTWTDAQGELSSQLTEQEQELLRVPLTWTKRAEESK